jgi:hypothetical protein
VQHNREQTLSGIPAEDSLETGRKGREGTEGGKRTRVRKHETSTGERRAMPAALPNQPRTSVQQMPVTSEDLAAFNFPPTANNRTVSSAQGEHR